MPLFVLPLCRILVVLEASAINLYNVYNACNKRTKRTSTIFFGVCLVILQTTAVAVSFFAINNAVIISIIYSLSYFLWVPALVKLTRESIARLIAMLCTTMGFTLLGTTIAVLISNLLPKNWQDVVMLLTQTVIYAFFAPWYSHFCNGIFTSASNEISSTHTALLRLSIYWYFSVFFTYFALTTQQAHYSILCVLSMGLMGFSCYHILHSNVRTAKKADRLTQFVYEDDLTGLSNRTAFFSDGQMLIGRQSQFDVVFLDLNKFKSINDNFGHAQGNEYLKGFANGLVQASANIGTPYRMSGDEFVCIVKKGHGKVLSDRLASTNWHIFIKGIDFLGVSVGFSSYPEHGHNLDELVSAADKEMYKDKGKSKARVRREASVDFNIF